MTDKKKEKKRNKNFFCSRQESQLSKIIYFKLKRQTYQVLLNINSDLS